MQLLVEGAQQAEMVGVGGMRGTSTWCWELVL